MTFEMVIIPLTYIAVNYIKKWELVEEKKWLPLIAMVLGAFLGIGFGAYNGGAYFALTITGIIFGASASGIYDGTQARKEW